MTNATCDLGTPRSWQAVLDRAAGIKRLRDYACGLYKVVDRAGVARLYVVDEEPDA